MSLALPKGNDGFFARGSQQPESEKNGDEIMLPCWQDPHTSWLEDNCSIEAPDTSFGLDIIKEEEEEELLDDDDELVSEDDNSSSMAADEDEWNCNRLSPRQPHDIMEDPSFRFAQEDEEASLTTRGTYCGSWQQQQDSDENFFPNNNTNDTHSYSSSEKSSFLVDDCDIESFHSCHDVDTPWSIPLQVQPPSQHQDYDTTSVSDGTTGDCAATTCWTDPPSTIRGAWDPDEEHEEALSSASSLSTLAVSHDSISLPESLLLPKPPRRRPILLITVSLLLCLVIITGGVLHWERSRRQEIAKRKAALQPQRPLWLLVEEL